MILIVVANCKYIFSLKVTKHLGHLFYLTSASRWVCYLNICLIFYYYCKMCEYFYSHVLIDYNYDYYKLLILYDYCSFIEFPSIKAQNVVRFCFILSS